MPSLITKRGKKRYLGNVTVKGQRRSKLFPDDSAHSCSIAKEWEAATRAKLLVGGEDLTVAIWLDEYLDDNRPRLTRKTFLAKQSVFNRFRCFVGESLRVELVSKTKVRQYFKSQGHRPPGGLNEDLKHLANAFKWGMENLPLFPQGDSPFGVISKFPAAKHQRYVPGRAAFRKVRMEASFYPQDYAMLQTIYYTAARPIEAFRLKLDDLDFDAKLIRLWSRKGSNHNLTGRWVPMPPSLEGALKDWVDGARKRMFPRHQHVFLSIHFRNYGQPFTERRYFMRRLCKRAGVKPFGLYAIRHLRARIEYSRCKNLKDLQRLLGHQYSSTTDNYLPLNGLDVIDGKDEKGGVI